MLAVVTRKQIAARSKVLVVPLALMLVRPAGTREVSRIGSERNPLTSEAW